MKKRTWGLLALFFLLSKFEVNGQGYNFNLSFNQGNPGAYAGSDTETVGWIPLSTGGESSNRWSIAQNIPFQFFFYGTPVTQFKVSLNGQITFSNPTGSPSSTSNSNLPSAVVPDKSILCFWDEFSSSIPLNNNAKVYMKVVGNLGSRQLWIKWTNFQIGNPATTYANFAAVIEESNYKVYIVDMNHASRNITATIGLQNNSIQAFQFGNNYFGFFSTNDGPGTSDNDFYEFTPQLTDDAGITQIDNPTGYFGSGTGPVSVSLKNYSPGTLTNVLIHWTVNGIPQPSYLWNGSLAALASTSVTIGTYNFVAGKNYTIVATVDSPNNHLDIDTTNDGASKSVCPMMIGTFKIGGSGSDFPTFNAAISQLQCAGLEGNVTLKLQKSVLTQTESVVIPTLYGLSANKRLILTADTIVSTLSSNGAYTIKLDGADYVTIKKITVENVGNATFTSVIQLVNRADFNIVEDAIINGTLNLSNNSSGISIGSNYFYSTSSPNNGNGNIFRRNQFNGMRYGVNMVSNNTAVDSGNQIIGNIFISMDRAAINTSYQKAAFIKGNQVTGFTNGTFSQGIYSVYDQDINVIGNKFSGTNNEAISFQNLSSTGTARCVIANNMVIRNANQSTFSDAVRMFNSSGFDFIGNSISVLNSSGYCFSTFNVTNFTIQNNSFSSILATGTTTNTSRGVNLGTTSTPLAFNYNNFFISPSTYTPLRIGTTDYTNATLIGAGGYNTNSYIGDPGYLDPNSDLHCITTQLNNKADSSVAIKYDFDDELRPFTPNTLYDIGCDEFNLLPNDIGVTSFIAPYYNGRLGTTEALGNSELIKVRVTNYGVNPQTNIPIRFSINGNNGPIDTIKSVLTGGTSMIYTFSTPANLSAAGTYKLKVFSLLTNDADRSNDTSEIKNLVQYANPVTSFPYREEFENMGVETFDTSFKVLTGAPDFDYLYNGNDGRMRTQAGAGFAASGSNAITLDRSTWIFGTQTAVNYLRLTKNMSTIDTNESIVLDFDMMHHSQEAQPNNKVWVRGNDTSTWLPVLDLNLYQGTAGIYRNIRGVNISNVLRNGKQNFSSSTQIRFGQEGLYRAYNINYTDGYTFDNIGLRKLFRKDVSATALITPIANTCGDSFSIVKVRIKNIGIDTQSVIPVKTVLDGIVSYTHLDSVKKSLVLGDSIDFIVGTINSYYGGYLQYEIYTQLPFDENKNNDTIRGELYINGIPLAPTTSPKVTCQGDPAILFAGGNADTYNWYDSLQSKTILATTDTFITPPILNNRTYYVSGVNINKTQVGPVDNTFGSGGYLNAYYVTQDFDLYREAIIDTVFIYPASTGKVNVNLVATTGEILYTSTIDVTTPLVKTPVPLHLRLKPGSYRLAPTNSTVTGLYRNFNGASNPYMIPNAITLKSPTAGGSSFYYYFYDWRVTIVECESPRVPISVSVNAKPLVNIGPDIDTCNGNISIILNAGNAGNGFSYFWLPDSSTNQYLTATQTGIYVAKVTNPLTGCYRMDTAQLKISSPPLPNLGPDTTICGNRLVLNPKIGGTGVNYLWSPGNQTSTTISVTNSGYYAVKAQRPGQNCFGTDTILVTLNPTPQFSLGNDTTNCGDITVGATVPGMNYLWSSGSIGNSITASSPGNYWLKVTNPNNGCTAVDSIQVNAYQKQNFTLGNDISQCGGSVTLNAGIVGDHVQYVWNNSSATAQITTSNTGMYSVLVYDSTSTCSYSDSINVLIKSGPSFSFGPDRSICYPEELSVGSSNFTKTWSNGDTSESIWVSTSGIYWVTVTNTQNGCSLTDSVLITKLTPPTVTISNDTIICGKQFKIQSKTTNAVRYSWSNGDTTSSIVADTSGNYLLTVFASNGCTANDSISLTIDPVKVNLGLDTTHCGPISLSTNISGFQYTTTWLPNIGSGSQVNISSTGTYMVNISNSFTGCSSKDTIQVTIKQVPSVEIGNDTTICGNQLFVQNYFTNANTNYLWNGVSGQSNMMVNQTGKYTLTAINKTSGCSVSDSIDVVLNPIPAIFIGNDAMACNQYAIVGNLQILDYHYQWNTPDTGNIGLATQTGLYTAWVTNRITGCSASDSVYITINKNPQFSLGNDTTTCFNGPILGTGLPTGLQYLWNNNAVSSSIPATTSGTYWVTLTNPITSCFATDTILVFIDTVEVNLAANTSACDSLTILGSINQSNLNVTWLPSYPPVLIRTITQSDTYYLTATNPLTGCTATDSQIVQIDVTPTVTLGNDTLFCTNDSVPVIAVGTASKYTWNTGFVGSKYFVHNAGIYSVVASNNQCIATDTIQVYASSAMSPSFLDTRFSLTLFVTANYYPFTSYQWNFGDGNTGTGLSTSHTYARSGIYPVQLTISDPCKTDTLTRYITVTALGSNNIPTSDEINVYPNPAANEFIVQCDHNNEGAMIVLTDAVGRYVKTQKLVSGMTQMTIHTEDLPNGMYWMRFTSGSFTTIKKVIIQR